MAKDNHSNTADQILKSLSAELKKDPTSGASIFVDLLTAERFSARATATTVIRYSLTLNVLLVCLVVYLAFPRTEFKVAQQKLDGSLAEIATTHKPYYDLEDIKAFAQKRAVMVHNWDYGNYIQRFEDERAYWDVEPLEQYVDTLLARGAFDSAKDFRRRFTAVVPAPAEVVQQVKYNGNYRIYRVSLRLTDESVDLEGVDSKDWIINMDVREVLPEEGWAGLKVMRYDEAIAQ